MLTDESSKYQYALDLALALADSDDTDVTEAQVRAWNEYDLYEWLEAGWNYEWDGRQWRPVIVVT